MTKRYALDTNVLLRIPNVIETLEEYKLSIPSVVLRELENFEIMKYKYGEQLAYEARQIRRGLNSNIDKIYIDLNDYKWDLDNNYSSDYNDNSLLKYCISSGDGLITYDGLLKQKAIKLGIEVIDIEEELDSDEQNEYTGYIETYMSPSELTEVYQNLDDNKWGLLQNQYLIVKDDMLDQVLDALRWDGNCLIRVNHKGFSTMQLGKFKPNDFYQQCALDSMINNQLSVIKGRSGSGKSLIALNYAWNQIEKGKYNKLVIFFNPVNTKNSSKLGFYKGDKNAKLIDGTLGAILSSKFGDISVVETLIASGKLVLYPFADIRGVDLQDSICWVVEAENLDIDLLKIGIQRIAESSKMIIDGDYHQIDSNIFSGNRNGMKRVSEVFRGKDMYGEVELKHVYRSRIAEIADKM